MCTSEAEMVMEKTVKIKFWFPNKSKPGHKQNNHD
jgi:hypothetical protein